MYSNYGFAIGTVPITRRVIPETFPYEVISPPPNLPITLDEAKSWLKIPLSQTAQDDLLTFLIESVRDYFQDYTNRILIDTEFATYRNCFPCCGGNFEIRRAIVDPSSVSIQYKVDGVFTLVPATDYYVITVRDYPGIYLNAGKAWPTDIDRILQAVRIEFTAGYGTTSASIPSNIKHALLMHLAEYYANRGDCDAAACACGAKSMYDKFKVISLSPLPKRRCNCS